MSVKGRVVIDEKYCKGCELCAAACPKGLLALDEEHLNSKGYHPAHLTGEGCTGCALCAIACPDAAITVYREKTKADDNTHP